ncbi:HAMP domain-containing sensor histidine kinase [Ferrovibrio sp.]|uniref:sensor histidine kinase n=1 Tax=Ferrovibrio sp. TaxID=1917215 RepID=UPI0026070A35|nr:HAMP domain-containing sensor histidine kinase [Ferrovibrio sp.]
MISTDQPIGRQAAQEQPTRAQSAREQPAAGSEPRQRNRDPVLGSFRQVVPINGAVTLINASALVLLLINAIPGQWLLAWWLLHAVPALYMLFRWLRRSPAKPADGRQRMRRYDAIVAAISGASWGVAALFLPLLSEQQQLLVIMVAAGMIAGSAATLAVVPNAATIFMLLIATPYILFFIQQATTISLAMAVLSILYVAAMILTNRIVNGVIRRNRRLYEENSALYERIRAAQSELLDIAESTEAFAFLDAQGRLQLWNRRLPALLGLADTDLERGIDFELLLRHAGLPDALLTSEIAGGMLQLPNGRWVQIGRRVTPQGDHALILTDMSEQQQASAQLQAQNARLEELFRQVSLARDAALRASQAKSIFLANMSHELRTPLNAIIGFSDIVQKKMFGAASPKYDEYLNDINGSARHLLAVIDDILDLARIEANQIALHESDVMLDEEIPICARLAASHYGRPAHAVTVDLPETLPALHADARLVRQILINLIGNALKFSSDGMVVETGARLDEQSGEISLWVRDHGIGIAPQDQARIFDPFEQADTQLSRNYGGVGLGLSLVRAFVQAHQGRISIDSAPGKGTLITVTFPAARTRRD